MKRIFGLGSLLLLMANTIISPISNISYATGEEEIDESIPGGEEIEQLISGEDEIEQQLAGNNKYTVRFINADTNIEVSDSIEVDEGENIVLPVLNKVEHMNFLGWYNENTCDSIFDESENIANDRDIYACYEIDWDSCYTPLENFPWITNEYTCSYEDIELPSWATRINRGTYAGKTIRSIKIPNSVGTDTSYGIFEGAILNDKIDFSNSNISKKSFEGAIIGSDGDILLPNDFSLNNIEIRDGGILTVSGGYLQGSSNNMVINGTLILNIDNPLYNALQYLHLGSNGSIVIGNNVEMIIGKSFQYSELTGTLILPTNLNQIGQENGDNTFGYSKIYSTINFPDTLGVINKGSFFQSEIKGDLVFGNSDTLLKGFDSAVVNSLIFNGTDLELKDFGTLSMSGDFICNDCNLVFNTSNNIDTIDGKFKIITNGDIDIPNGYFHLSKVGEDLMLSGRNVPIYSVFQQLKVGRDIVINGDFISLKYGVFNGTTVGNNFNISGNLIDLQFDVLNAMSVGGNMIINASFLKADNGVLNKTNVLGDFVLPSNVFFGSNVLGGIITNGSSAVRNNTTVSIGNSTNPVGNTIKIVTNEVSDVSTDNNKTTVQNVEIEASSGKVVEYLGGLEIYFQDSTNVVPEIIEGTAKFSSPIAVKVPVANTNSEYVKIKVKHSDDEDFGYTGLTLNPENSCSDGLVTLDQYSGENVPVIEGENGRYAVIYTCSASTFVAYSENEPIVNNNTNQNGNDTQNVVVSGGSSSGGGRSITSSKQESKSVEQKHNSADTENINVQENTKTTSNQTTDIQTIQGKVKSFSSKSITRGELAVMTNILLEVFPQLTENKSLNNGSEACENYVDEQNFTKDEKNAITRLCKLSIMGIHEDTKEPLDEFLVNQKATNREFVTVISRVLATYIEKDLSLALKKLENNEEGVVFGTVYNAFMSIKNIFN